MKEKSVHEFTPLDLCVFRDKALDLGGTVDVGAWLVRVYTPMVESEELLLLKSWLSFFRSRLILWDRCVAQVPQATPRCFGIRAAKSLVAG